MTAILNSIIRALLALMAGTVGSSDADLATALKSFFDSLISGNTNSLISAGITLGVIVWSIYEKRKAEAAK